MDIANVTFAYIMQGLAVIIILFEGYKKIMELKKTSDEDHDRKQKWDHAAKVIEDKAEAWDKGLNDVYAEREAIVDRYDGRLNDQDARIQQLLSMMCMCLRAQDAILEALVKSEIGNGEIKSMHKELKDFIMEQVQQ